MRNKNKNPFLLLLFVGATIALTLSSCSNPINAVEDIHFNEDGELLAEQTTLKIEAPQQINFYVEVSGSMNGFFRGNFATNFKKDVYHIMSQLSPLAKEVKLLSNGGTIDSKISIADFRNMMNSGGFASTASTDMPTMLQSIINDLDSAETAILISDMVYSPVGNAAPNVLLTQYSSDVAKIIGSSQKAVCLIAATSEFLDKSGNIQVKESPYYYLIIGEPGNVSFVRNAISTLLEQHNTFVDNIESGFDYKQAGYSFGHYENALPIEKQPTFYDYDEESGPCLITLGVDLSPYRWRIADKDIFKQCFHIKSTYGSVVSVDSIAVVIDNFNNKELKRKATANVTIKVSNMPQEADVLEWWVDTDPIDTDISLFNRFFGAADENDRTKSYSVDNFIMGIFQGGVVNKSSDNHNFVLISKIN